MALRNRVLQVLAVTVVFGIAALVARAGIVDDVRVQVGQNSYSAAENVVTSAYASAYDHPGVAITASSGDSGYQLAAPFPAEASPRAGVWDFAVPWCA